MLLCRICFSTTWPARTSSRGRPLTKTPKRCEWKAAVATSQCGAADEAPVAEPHEEQ